MGEAVCQRPGLWAGAVGRQACLWGAPLSQQPQCLGTLLAGTGWEQRKPEEAAEFEGCGLQRKALLPEAGMEEAPRSGRTQVWVVSGGVCGSDAVAKQRALSHNQTFLA